MRGGNENNWGRLKAVRYSTFEEHEPLKNETE